MASKGQRKLPEPDRRAAVARYESWLRNMPKRICADFKINRQTLRAYFHEIKG